MMDYGASQNRTPKAITSSHRMESVLNDAALVFSSTLKKCLKYFNQRLSTLFRVKTATSQVLIHVQWKFDFACPADVLNHEDCRRQLTRLPQYLEHPADTR